LTLWAGSLDTGTGTNSVAAFEVMPTWFTTIRLTYYVEFGQPLNVTAS